jgi:hypothetical protein
VSSLRQINIGSVLIVLLINLEDEDTFFNKVFPVDLIAAVMGSATPDTTFESMELIKLCNAPLVFDNNKKLSLQLKQRTKYIKDLLWVHKIETGETECMAKWLCFMQDNGGKDFEDKAAEWKAKTTHNSFSEFKAFLSPVTA